MQNVASQQDDFYGDRMTAQVARWAEGIAAVLSPDESASALQLERLGGRDGRAVYKVVCGTRVGVLKLFDHSRPALRDAYLRERDMLVQLKGWSRTARHLAHCDAGGFVLTQYLRGTPVSQYAERHGALSVARAVGVWLGGLDARMITRPAFASWSDYLASVRTGLPQSAVDGADAALGSLPVRGMALARNDGNLSNFVMNGSGHCLGFDFERARVKPRGWDFVLTALELTAQSPGPVDPVLDRLADGFASVRDQNTLVQDLRDVVRFLFTEISAQSHKMEG
ncbi:MAG: aminoglycoside phosphotransferase family protein [Rhodobacteraceae bacterium]|nr:aminoglycoside phosphotransferase family protein [Paracoccaceae bacterium]